MANAKRGRFSVDTKPHIIAKIVKYSVVVATATGFGTPPIIGANIGKRGKEAQTRKMADGIP